MKIDPDKAKFGYIMAQIIALMIALSPVHSRSNDIVGPQTGVADFMNSRNYKGAIDRLNESIRLTDRPEQKAWDHYNIGFIYYEYVHDYDLAILSFQRALNIKASVENPSEDLQDCTVLSQMSIADVYRRVGKYDKALEEYKIIMNQYPGTRYPKIAESDVKGVSDAIKEIEIYNKIIASQPESDISAKIQFEIAELYLSPQNLNNPAQAIEEYTKVVEKYPNNPFNITSFRGTSISVKVPAESVANS